MYQLRQFISLYLVSKVLNECQKKLEICVVFILQGFLMRHVQSEDGSFLKPSLIGER